MTPLRMNPTWRFETPGSFDRAVINALSELVGKIATQTDSEQRIYERFKSYFARAQGFVSSWSSSSSWAQSDLDDYMTNAAANAPAFIAAFCDACEDLRDDHPDWAFPPLTLINRILSENGAGFVVRDGEVVAERALPSIAAPTPSQSLSEQAHAVIQRSWAEAEKLLTEGRNRPAVQEVLWLLETVSTAFQGVSTISGTVEGKYFNTIAADLRRVQKGTVLHQAIDWIAKLHGFLSSPTGGAIRHGGNIRDGGDIEPSEARLYCNLIQSYITYLIAEHERLTR